MKLTCLAALLLAVGSATGCSSTTPTTPTTATPTTLTFGSALAMGGSTSRQFTTSTAGTVKVTLTAFAAGQAAGLGIGVPTPTAGSPCALTQSVVTTAGGSPQIVIPADQGSYCVQIYDIGDLPGDAGFLITIEYP